ncbi:ABC transporter permease [Streptomyces sp. GQFP]|uniref:ABC transporter permease n=1 Tax=Streptomyces sp. GQFP TaxID=2907545 RepID=UPI001F2C5C76|nr:ABC transporter permease [Streptomyces sp. GQFP]UIX31948.1 ABC transporter permease [Streptomyces sp. GQFP]
MPKTPAPVDLVGPKGHSPSHRINPPDAVPARSGLAGGAAIFAPVAIVLAVGAIFISVYLAAFHAPRPHDLPVGVVGSEARAAQVRAQLPTDPADAFQVRALPDEASARSAIEHGDLFAAYIPGDGTPKLLYAGAHGPSVTSLVGETFGDVARAGGQRLDAVDVVPASPADTRGLVVFYTTFGLVLAGYLFGLMTYQLAPRITIGQRLASLATFGVLGGLVIAGIVRLGFDALPAPFFGIAGLVTLVAMAVGSSTMLLLRAFGVAGSSIGAVVFMTLGNATSGGSLPPEFLPAWLHPLSSVLPVGVGVRAVNGLAYLHNDGLVSGIAVLGAWTAVAAGLLYALDRNGGRSLGGARPQANS